MSKQETGFRCSVILNDAACSLCPPPAGNLYAVRKKGWSRLRLCVVVVVCLVLLLRLHQMKRRSKELLAAAASRQAERLFARCLPHPPETEHTLLEMCPSSAVCCALVEIQLTLSHSCRHFRRLDFNCESEDGGSAQGPDCFTSLS